jgi:hypothetical protein
VPALDGDDLGGGSQGRLRQIGRLAVVGRDPGVLEQLGRVEEGAFATDRAAEVELRRLRRRRAQRVAQEVDMRLLVLGDGLREFEHVPPERPGADGSGVEGRLEVLELEREAEDLPVERLGGRGARRLCADEEERAHRAGSDERAARAHEPVPRVAHGRRAEVGSAVVSAGLAHQTLSAVHTARATGRAGGGR